MLAGVQGGASREAPQGLGEQVARRVGRRATGGARGRALAAGEQDEGRAQSASSPGYPVGAGSPAVTRAESRARDRSPVARPGMPAPSRSRAASRQAAADSAGAAAPVAAARRTRYQRMNTSASGRP
ncbi:hypothetical protein AB0910_16325 [Streptomyces sp. NPDC047002]|uniref:hypothetical protein n=1 Tax=Streptomyces sp. NPDC047002 TaxID=3155475 RepID=UPI0034571A9C